MFVRRSLRFLVPSSSSSSSKLATAAFAALLLVSGCAGDGGARPAAATEPAVAVSGASATAAAAPNCDAVVADGASCASTAEASPPETTPRGPAPYGWRLHRAPRRVGGTPTGISWRTAGQSVNGITIASASSSDQQRTPMVMSAAPVPVSFQVESDGDAAPLAGLIPATATAPVAEPATPAVQTVALVSPSTPAPPQESEATAVAATTADPARASEALVAYASVATKPDPATANTTTMILSPTLSPSPSPSSPESAAAAEQQAIPEAERPEWIINVATHANADDAKRHVDQLIAAGFKATARQETVRGRTSYRVVIERLPSETAAQSALADLNAKYGNGSAWSMRKR